MSDDARVAESERLADLLCAGRRTTNAVDPHMKPWLGLTAPLAQEIAEVLYQRAGTSRAWKLGALDTLTQRRLGLSGPVCIPLLDGAIETDVRETVVRLADLVAPRFEAEIGIVFDGEALLGVPCVEVADCRFADWELPPFGMTVDLALQGRMIFGLPGDIQPEIEVVVTRDDEPVVSGRGSWVQAVARLSLLPDRSSVDQVATGSITAMLDCWPGRWDFNFGALGGITVTVF